MASSPTGISGSISIPSRMGSGKSDSSIPSSPAEHIIPKDSIPLSLLFLIFDFPGRCAPVLATGIYAPSNTFVALVTMVKTSLPTSTLQTTRLSALGCLLISRIFPMTTFFIPSPRYVKVSTLVPVMVSRSHNSETDISISTNSFSQLIGTSISHPP